MNSTPLPQEHHIYDSPHATVFSTLIILLSATSCLANPLMFLYNHCPPVSLAKFLFKLMAVIDLLTGIICSVTYLTLFLDPSKKYHYVTGSNDISLGIQILSLLCWALMQFSYYVMASIACTRAIKILLPFQHISKCLVHACLLVAATWTLFINTFLLFGTEKFTMTLFLSEIGLMVGGLKGKSQLQSMAVYYSLPILASLLSLCFSSVSIAHLLKNRGCGLGSKQLGILKIMILTLGSFACMCLMMTHFGVIPAMMNNDANRSIRFPLLFSMSSLPSIILAGFDPIIFLLLTPKSQQFARDKFKTIFNKCPWSVHVENLDINRATRESANDKTSRFDATGI